MNKFMVIVLMDVACWGLLIGVLQGVRCFLA